ncbi:MAG: hypothetical protein IH594_08250, partial [Bacteroidales bacterium]|nr:hypothetical protein [Bacteroidales bacterium]
MKNYISIIDLGTGSIRNTVYAMEGEEMWSRRYENPLIQPKPGYAEQDPVAWWDILLRSFIEMPSDIKSRIVAISVTSQREGIVPVDASFMPLGKIIIWLDGRSRSEAAYIGSVLGREQIYDICGLIPNPAWSLSKILWLRNNEPELFNNAYKFLQAEDYFISRLAGKAVTEFSIASRTCLLDVYNKSWSDKILDTFSIPEHKLPELREPGSFVGYIREEIVAETGLPEGTMIYTGAGDQQAAAVGAGAFGEGMASIGIGTSSAISMTIASPVPDAKKKIILNCAALPGKWEYEPPIWNTGGLIKWFYENITGQHQQYEQLIGDAGKIPPGSEGLIALPYFSGAGSPRWDPELRGCFYGLSLAHNQSHML